MSSDSNLNTLALNFIEKFIYEANIYSDHRGANIVHVFRRNIIYTDLFISPNQLLMC